MTSNSYSLKRVLGLTLQKLTMTGKRKRDYDRPKWELRVSSTKDQNIIGEVIVENNRGGAYKLNWKEGVCACPSFRYKKRDQPKTCKHLEFVRSLPFYHWCPGWNTCCEEALKESQEWHVMGNGMEVHYKGSQ